MAQEIELKLVVTDAAADKVGDLVAATLFPDVTGSTATLHATYFDTPDQRLRKYGASLRIRRKADERIQTIKIDSAKGAGLFSRPEWERAVDDDTPILDDTTPLALLPGPPLEGVGPVFTVAVERTTWRVRDDVADIEIVLDRGSVTAGDRSSPVCEIELELKQGDPAALFALARQIGGLIPVRLGVLTKSERGYALSDASARAFKAEPVRLDAAMTPAAALQAIIGGCLRHYRLNETILLETRAPEALHQARVALRRLRSALKIFKSVVGKEDAARLQAEVRPLARILGTARDVDVLSDAVTSKIGRGPVHTQIEHLRDTAYEAVDAALGSPRTMQLMLDLVAWSATGPWIDATATATARAMPVSEFAAMSLRKRRKQLKIGHASLEDLDTNARHRLRKSAKTLRYAAEFFAGLFEKDGQKRRRAGFVRTLEKLQDRLGILNDRSTAPMLLRDHGLLELDGAAALIDRHGVDKLVHRAGKAHRRLLDRKRFWE